MPISLDAVYKPLNQFFVQKFGQAVGAPVFFRFAQLPVGFYDSDFLSPMNPELGPSAALAAEHLSFLVDGITRLDENGTGVWLDPPRISELYFDEILRPSLPRLPAGVSDAQTQTVLEAFGRLKEDAQIRWSKGEAASLIPGHSDYRICTAHPTGWWNKSDTGAWTHKEFKVEGAATSDPGRPPPPLLRLKPRAADIEPMFLKLQAPVAAAPVSGTPPAVRAQLKSFSGPTLTRSGLRAELAVPHRPLSAKTAILADRNLLMAGQLKARTKELPMRNRLDLQLWLSQSTFTQPVSVSDVTISFDYCLVRVTRDWMHTAFLNSNLWYLPGQSRGAFSRSDGRGFPALPVGFVALKNLRIKAPWTPADVTNLEQSIQFGPFNFESQVIDGAIGQDDIQVVGWILQDMPELPPNDPV
jgi:hypothetical protein